MITLIGTGHVFDIGSRVREEIRLRGPQVVGVELDAPRYHALRQKNRDRRGVPLVYRMLADFQTRVAKEYGVEAGDEMLAAAAEARELGVPLALIDKDARQTFHRLREEMSWREKLRLVGSAVVGVLPLMPGKSIEKQVEEMQDDYTAYFDKMATAFPTLKRVLLDERNDHMARALDEMAKTQDRIVAVMGDGHVDGVHAILSGFGHEVEAVRLAALRAPREDAPLENPGDARYSVSVDDTPPPPREW